ncbi:MAG: heme ABC transporter ATP-binding protein [Bacteroidetes bacterium]|nr:heme ABC transporter ATP-binding protein [Bacteroidota bacterium]
MIRIERLGYAVGDKKLLEDIHCQLRPGELTVLLGANGAGKSTLLRLLSGELRLQQGSIYWKSLSLADLSPRQLALQRAVLGQHYAVNLPFTGEEVVMMGRYPHYDRHPSGRDKAIVKEVLERVAAKHLASRLFNTMSGGEQQRVQLARVLAQLEEGEGGDLTGKFLLLDEPTASMDYWHQQLCLQQARELCRRGLTVIMVLHDLNLAAQVADQLLVLKGGRLVASGTPAELLDAALIRDVYGLETKIFYPEPGAAPVVIVNLQTC